VNIVVNALDVRRGGAADSEAQGNQLIAKCLTASERWDGETETFLTHTLTAGGFDASEDGTGRGTPLVADTVRSHPRPGSNSLGAIAFNATQDPISNEEYMGALSDQGAAVAVGLAENQHGELVETPYSHQLSGGGGKPGQGYAAVRIDAAVRRLTPTECERLQGFPDGWTIPTGPSLVSVPSWYATDERREEDPLPDGPRYAAMGNAVTVPVIEWIGRRIVNHEEMS
jgi:DNA (cytosine-5)-methyltransferase 1